ncbi:dienelactone hydrolase family protein [Nocardioides sp. GXQ0305]|uniref:dienelactone hydrolase family protein n=1 Tax=Nocardioides sp. GXQ0305 TaxID=3423912 RepID=UPI003D7CF9B8
MTMQILVPASDGDMPAHMWLPEAGRGPGLLLLQEIFGVSGYVQRRAADLAAAGYVVLAPELYWRLDQQVVDEQAAGAVDRAMELAGKLDWETTVADAVAAYDALSRLDQVRGAPGVVGFCFGGGLAFNVAAEVEPAVLVSYYGSAIPQLLDLAPRVTCPSLHHFGTADDYLDRGTVSAITEAVTADGRPARVELYDGANHAFDNDDFVLHHPGASRRAWVTTLAFLHEQLPT